MNRNAIFCTSIAALGALSAAAMIVLAGPLDPPVGPVGSTLKTLGEVEPRIAINQANTPGDADSLFRITQPGSYYLTGNILGVTGKSAIEIASDNVQVDLMGFALTNAAGGTRGVFVAGTRKDVSIRNGTVTGWGSEGIDAGSLSGGAITGVQCVGNGSTGMFVGEGIRIEDCLATGHLAFPGFWSLGPCLFIRCVSESNGSGFVVTGGTLDGCIARNNADGFFVSEIGGPDRPGATISNCVADSNVTRGFASSVGAGVVTLIGCAATGSGTHAFNLLGGGVLSGCAALSTGGPGFVLGPGSRAEGCSSVANTIGFQVGAGSEVRGCTARANTQRGIDAAERCTLSANTSTDNTLDGIRVANDCRVIGNLCSGNGAGAGSGAGILATGIDNHIDGNTCTDADRGVECATFGNFIVRNTCSGNTSNWNLAADNHYGPIVNITAVPAPAVSGAGGATSVLTNTDPNANFSY